jgi:hypothetical protein
MPLSPLEYLRHMLDEAEYLLAESQRVSKDQFLQDETLILICFQDAASTLHGLTGLLIGVGTAGYPAAPPSEPYVRISRIRLSGRWFTAERIDRPDDGLW